MRGGPRESGNAFCTVGVQTCQRALGNLFRGEGDLVKVRKALWGGESESDDGA